jgi:hypothetical protein
VISRELRTAPGLPFGGVGHITRWIDGTRLREDTSLSMEPLARDSSGAGGVKVPPTPREGAKPVDAMEVSAIWSADDRTWLMWSKDQDVYDAASEDSLARGSGGADEMSAGFAEFFGTGQEVVQEVTVSVDSAGPESTIAGVPSRRYLLRAEGRYYEIEKNSGGAIAFVRTVWTARAIPGVSPSVPRLQDGPSRVMAGTLTGMQFLIFPMFRQALDRLDTEVAKLPGQRMLDALQLETPRDSIMAGGPSGGAPPKWGGETLPIYEEKVLEVRTEPSRPDLFRLPAGLHKRGPPSPVEVREVPPPAPRSRRPR